MIWFMVKAPPPKILQVSQWLRRIVSGRTRAGDGQLHSPENVLGLLLVELDGPGGLAAVTLSVVRHVDQW